jgi:hypothetical protein
LLVATEATTDLRSMFDFGAPWSRFGAANDVHGPRSIEVSDTARVL